MSLASATQWYQLVCFVLPLVRYFMFVAALLSLGQARIRVQLSAVHSKEDIDRCIDGFTTVAKAKGVIS